MNRWRWIRALGATALLVAIVAGVAFLVGRPSTGDDVLHRVSGVDAEDAVQVGTTVVLADWNRDVSLLDLESGEVRSDIADPWTLWYGGRGPVAVVTTHLAGATAYGHDGAVLWTVPDVQDVEAIFADGVSVLTVCPERGCELRAVQIDGEVLWSAPKGDGRETAAGWFTQELTVGQPHQLPDHLVTQTRLSGPPGEVRLLDPDTGQATALGQGRAVAGDGLVAVLDSQDGACDLTIVRESSTSPVTTDLSGVCPGTTEPRLALLGDNVAIWGEQDVLISTAGGNDTVAVATDDLLNTDLTAAGLIGLDKTSWLFGTNGGGAMQHRAEGDLLIAHGAETIVVTSYRQPWNPFAGDSVRHEVLDPVTGEVCGTLEATALAGALPLPGCRAVLVDPRTDQSFVVGRP